MSKKEKYILMHRDDEVLSFEVSFDSFPKVSVLEKLAHFEKAPYGMKEDSSQEELDNILFFFFNRRTIAGPRWDIEDIFRYTGVENLFELSFKGHGLSLSNHYWFKKVGENLRYEDINFFTNKWDDSFARAVLKGDYEALKGVDLNVPDIVTPGWAIKGWLYEDGGPKLYKLGIAKDHSEEPIAEVLASKLAKRMLKDEESLEYELKEIYGKLASVSRPITGIDEELVPLSEVLPPEVNTLYSNRAKNRHLNQEFFDQISVHGVPGLGEFFVKAFSWRSLCFVSDMHFDNLSVIRNFKTGKIKTAPLYDFGGAFGSSASGQALLSNINKGTYILVYFLFGDLDPNWDYSWYRPQLLLGFEDEIRKTLSKSDFYTPALIDNLIDVYQHQRSTLDALASKNSLK